MTLQDCVVQRIYRLLIQMDWTMKQLSEQCGIPLAELESLMKQETADWTLEQLCTICRAFSISLPEIFRCTHVSAALSAGNTITAAIFRP